MTAVLAHGGHIAPSVAVSTALLRWVVLLAATAVACWRLRRGREGDALLAALVAAVVCDTSPVLLVHRTAATVWLAAVIAWLVPPRRLATAGVAVMAGATAALTGLWLAVSDRVRLDGLAFDRLVLLKVLLLTAAVALGLRRRTRLEVASLLAASAVGSALVLVPLAPPAGRPVLTAAGALAVSVVPQRPGSNWVHVDTEHPVTVNAIRSTTLAGATGQWVRVMLPRGRSSLKIREIGSSWERLEGGAVIVDAGHGAPVAVDGPECASVWTAASLAGRTPTACPSQHLNANDAAALDALASWLARRHVSGIQVMGDSTPRSVQAQALLVTARTRLGLSTRGALIVTSGWTNAASQLASLHVPANGVFLSPWLVSGPLLSRYGELAPLAVLPFDPSGPQALRYAAALPAGEVATAAGFAAWGGHDTQPRVYASAPVSILPPSLGHEHPGGGWFPGGALTAVSARLPDAKGLS